MQFFTKYFLFALFDCQQATKKLDSYTHGSRFYNVKQFRNACVRQLAKAKSYDAAFEILQENFPLHNQDWACHAGVNRAGADVAAGGCPDHSRACANRADADVAPGGRPDHSRGWN